MKKAFKVITLLMLVILVVTAFTMPASAKQVFTDLSPEHWCYAKIMDFEKKGYVCGYSDNTFRADRTITRAEYVKIVNNFFGYKPSEKTTSAFKDVNSGDWFMPYVNEAVDRGYIEGFEDGTFRPQDPIRRQEATVILARILKIDKEVYPADHKDGLAQYSDSDEVQEWARVAIHSYSVYNFINGYEDGTLRILRNVTRAETVELLHILEQKVVIDRKPGGGGTKTPTLKPDIDVLVRNLIEVPVENEIAIKEEYTPVIYTKSNWINKKNSNFEKETARNGAFVNITSQTRGSTIHDTVDVISRKEEYKTTKRNEYDNKFFLTDGVYTVTAQATKSGRKDSGIETKVVKIDTVAPVVRVVETSSAKGKIAHEQSVAVAIKDSNLYNANEISGLDKVAYAWFNADNDERVTVWSAFELVNGQAQINAPLTYGKYKLGIAAIDVAENAFGTRTEYAVKSEDISGDVPTTPSGDVDYDFVKETESGDENPDQNPNGEELIVIVGNNNPTIEDLTMYTTANKLVSGELKGKDIDSGDVLSYELNNTPNYGTTKVNGNKTTYVSDKAGTYKYTVKVRDNHSGEAIGNVTVYVFDAEIEIPDAPSGEEIQDPVNPNNPVNPDLSGEKLVLFVGEEKEMTASVTPSYEDTTYDWTFDVSEEKAEISSNSDECTVKVKGLKPGETKITIKVKVNVKAPNGGTETLEIEKQIPVIVLSKITIKIPDATKAYNGIALKAEDFEVRSGDEALKAGVMADGDVAKVRVSGERLYVGSSDAALVGYDILDGNGNSVRKYYVPTFEKGTLTVTVNENEIIIKANSANKKYDGTALKNSGYTYTSGVLVSGDVLEAVISGEQLNAGSSDNKVISYKVTRNSVDVTGNYTFGECVDGVLEVTKRKVTLTSASATKVYDGLPLTSGDVTVTGDDFVSGEGASYKVTGTITNVGEVDNEFTYTLNAGTLAGNYEITAVEGTLEVTPITEEVIVKVKGNSASGDKYDGQEKSVEGYEVVDITNVLYNSKDVSYSGDAIAKGTNAGTYPMELDAGKFRNNSKNFTNVKFEILEDGKLVIAKRVIELISASDEKEYDGTPLTNDGITVGGDGFVAGEGAMYTVTGSQTVVGSGDNEFTYELNNNTSGDNYIITKTFGTLTVTECDDEIVVTIDGNKATHKYDGTEQTVKGYKVSINKPSLYSESDFEFSGEAKVTQKDARDTAYAMGLSEKNFKNISDNFNNVKFVVNDGSLTITKRDVTLTSATDEKEYDGTPLINDEITVGGDGFASGEGATYTVTGNQTVVGSGDNEFTYTLNDGTLEDNYNITKEVGKLTVKAKEVTYTVKYYKENLSGDYELADTETKKVTLNNGTEKAEYDENKYTDGFEFKKVEPEDLTIPASGKLVVKVYFARKSYTLTLIAGENVKEVTSGSATSGEIILKVKYGEKVNIGATLKEIAGYEVNFDKWESTHGKDITEKNTTITMPNSDLTLTAVATKEEKAPNVEINIKSDYPKNGKEAEPGDTIGYEATVKNEESRDIKVKIKIDSADEIDTIIVYNNDGKVVGTYGSLDETITIPADGRVKINYKSDVPNNHSVASDFESTVRVTPETGTKETRKTIENKIEKSATIVANNNKNKNVFLIVDLSKSMNEDGKIAALRTAATTFTNKLKTDSDSNGSDITLTLIGIGYGQGSDGTVTKTMYSTDGWNNETYAYKMGFYTKDNWSKLSKFINKKNIWGDYTNFYAYGGTNITGALEITHEIIAAGNKYGANLLKDNADTFTVLLTDGGNGYDGMVDILPTNPDALYLQKNSTIFAIAFGKGAKKGTKGYNDLLAVTGSEQSIYSAASQTDLDKAFETIANKIGEQQSKQGKILVELPESGRYFPIIITYSQNGENKELDIYTIEEAEAENIVIDEETKTLTWNLSGTKYSACEDLKLKLTLDNTATDGKSTEDTLELLSIESGETTVIVPVVDEKEDITSGDIDTSKENKTTVPGDTEIQNNDEAKSVSGEDQGLDNKDVELDNNENEQQNEEKKQEENVDGKEENQEVDNENQVNEVEGKQDEKVGDQKEDQKESEKETKEEPKPEEDNNEEVIIEEKKEPMILEEKQDDDDSNDTSDSDKKIE